MPVRVRIKYADGTIDEQIREGGKVMATKKKVARAKSEAGTVAVDFPEAPVEAYCMKCKCKQEVTEPKKVVISSRNAMKGTCSVCGTNVFKFIGGKVAGAKKKTKTTRKKKASTPKLSPQAQSAWDKLKKAGVLKDNWCGQLKAGAAVWWEGSAEEGWRLCMDDVQEAEMPEFKKLVLASL